MATAAGRWDDPVRAALSSGFPAWSRREVALSPAATLPAAAQSECRKLVADPGRWRGSCDALIRAIAYSKSVHSECRNETPASF
jgi:hypothetical protein